MCSSCLILCFYHSWYVQKPSLLTYYFCPYRRLFFKSDCEALRSTGHWDEIFLDDIFLNAQQREWMSQQSGARDDSPVLPLRGCSFLRAVFFFLCFCSLLTLCCVSQKSSASGECVTHDGRVDMLLMLFVVLQSTRHFPGALEKLVKEIKKLHWWVFVVFVCAFLLFSVGQITVGRFNSHYYNMKKGRRWQHA